VTEILAFLEQRVVDKLEHFVGVWLDVWNGYESLLRNGLVVEDCLVDFDLDIRVEAMVN
jgi:hypothetical protein